MKREFKHENFEEFIKRSADNLRMKAPDKLWQNLSKELNNRRRRPGAGISAFFLITALFGYLTISTTTTRLIVPKQSNFSTEEQSFAKKSRNKENPIPSLNRGKNIRLALDNNKTEEFQRETAMFVASALPEPASTPEQLSAQPEFTPTVADSDPEAEMNTTAKSETPSNSKPLVAGQTFPWTIESVTNAYAAKRKIRTSRFETQFHFSPTISYRKLTENKSYLRSIPVSSTPSNYAVLYGSVNSMVTHKPDLGFELGFTEKYAVSQKVKIRGGLQFNVNRYDIKAFRSQFSVASITLNNRRSARVDSLWTVTNYSNVDVTNNNSSWLQNFSFQVSAPIGVELALKGNEKMQFGIATSIQPTYILGDRSYVITNDYKNYTQVSWLLRRWNVNTAFETFVSYQSGKTKWQVGPQVRYQLLSSFISNYPVKENLFDFGLKVGLSINK